MNLINESQIFETWAPMIEEKTGITETAKLKWMTKYAHFHSLNEGFSYPQAGLLNTPGMGNVATGTVAGGVGNFYGGQTGSGDKFPSLLPLAIQVAARTVGFDIVSVVPMNGPAGVLTYLDYVYAGGRDPLQTPANGNRMPGSKAEKALMFKVSRSGLNATIIAAVTGAVAGTKYVIADADAAAAAGLLVSYVGKSRVDGALIFKIEGEASTSAAGEGTFSTWPGVQSIQLADVLDGTASIYGTLTITPGTNTVTASAIIGLADDVTGSAELVKALEDHIAGFTGAGPDDDQIYAGNGTNGLASYEPMKRGVGETSYYRTMGLQAFTKFVEAETFQVAAQVTTEQIQDLNRQYGIDVVSMVENQLVNEVSQSINKHILSRAFALGWQNHANFASVEGKDLNLDMDTTAPTAYAVGVNNFIGQDGTNLDFSTYTGTATIPGVTTFGAPGFENLGTIQRRIQSRILAAGNVVAQRGRRGPANFVVTNLQIATALQDSAQFTFYPLANTVNQNNGALYPLGTLAGMTIYVDPNMDYSDCRVLVGRKGADEEPGLKFMPYLMAESIQTIAEGTMSPKIAIKSRYALAEAGFHPETQYMCLYIAGTGTTTII